MPKIKNREKYHNPPNFGEEDKELVRQTIDDFINFPNGLTIRKFEELFDLSKVKFAPGAKEFAFKTINPYQFTQEQINDKITHYYGNSKYAQYITEYLSSPASPIADSYNYDNQTGENLWFKKLSITTKLSQIIHMASCFENLLKVQGLMEKIEDSSFKLYSQLFFHQVIGKSLIDFDKELKNYADSDYPFWDYNGRQSIFILTHNNFDNFNDAAVIIQTQSKDMVAQFARKAIKNYAKDFSLGDVDDKIDKFLAAFRQYRKDLKKENLRQEEEVKKIANYVSSFRNEIEPFNHFATVELYYSLWIEDLKIESIDYRTRVLTEFSQQCPYYTNELREMLICFGSNDGLDFLSLPNAQERSRLDIKNTLLKAQKASMLGTMINTLIYHTAANIIDKDKKELDKFLISPSLSLNTSKKIKQKI